ncbi:hypothetical protein ABZT06_08390 [Streptomyces sp. NPDC005483]|uniref:hypothetical protein n=1 Tax=Streptomyces sp. NPDC005483 TaxID=3154882 RepID=UPI0033AD2B90
MSEATPNQGLFRVYAASWLIAAVFAVTITFTATDLPKLGVAVYLGIGLALWAGNMLLTKGGPRNGHGLSHAVLAAAFALVWPLVTVALVVYSGRP